MENKDYPYFNERIFNTYGFLPEELKIDLVHKHDGRRTGFVTDIFTPDDKDNIKILVYTLDRKPVTYDHKNATPDKPNVYNNRTQNFYVTRLKVPQTYTDKKGNEQTKKYDIPPKAGTYPWFPPMIVQKFERREPIKTLVLTEGYFKAGKAAKHGADIVGFSSITHYKDSDTRTMYADVLRLISECKTENVIILYDGDCRNISTKALEKNDDLLIRPNGFIASARNIRDLLVDSSVNIYFAHVKSDCHSDKPKGLDDLLVAFREKETEVIDELFAISRPAGQYFEKINITANHGRLYSYFNVNTVENFYHYHSDFIKGRDFVYKGTKYRYNDEKNDFIVLQDARAKDFFRVGDNYYEFVHVPNKHKQLERQFHRRLKTTIVDDHGVNFVKHVPKYKAFCNVPDHKNYIQVQNNCFNMYGEFEHEPDPHGQCPTILKFIKHIFGSHYRMGMDYMQLLYQQPTQILPILCLVSKENNTGKTTLIKLLKYIFTSNCTVIGNEELSSSFNANWANKLIIACEESFIEKRVIVEKIKGLATGDKIQMNAKGRDQVEVDFFGKFILASNNETDFLIASEYDIRYWVIKVLPPTTDNPNLLRDMIDEVPSFLGYLERRTMKYRQYQSRMWFPIKSIRTAALERLISSSKPRVEKEIYEGLREWFYEFNETEFLLTTGQIIKEFLQGQRIEKSYIVKILREKIGVDMYRNDRGAYATKYFQVPFWDDCGADEPMKKSKGYYGRPWILPASKFLTISEINDLELK